MTSNLPYNTTGEEVLQPARVRILAASLIDLVTEIELLSSLPGTPGYFCTSVFLLVKRGDNSISPQSTCED